MPTNEEVIRELYRTAEVQDTIAFMALFTEDGYFWDVSAGRKYMGTSIGDTVEVYARAFPNMHRELISLYVTGDVVIVELTLNGSHDGPLLLSTGEIPATGKRICTPCCDVFHLVGGKVTSFHCYTAATILLRQLEIVGSLGGAAPETLASPDRMD